MKKAVLITAFVFVLLSISQISAVLVYNSAQSNIANSIHGDVLDDVDSLLKEVKKAEPRETTKKGLNAVNVKLARMIQVNVSSSVNLLKEVRKGEPQEPQPKREECGAVICQHDHPRD